MATTLTAATLTVTISTQINLNGQPINSENQLVIPSINEFDKRIMEVPTSSEVTLVAFGTQVAAGTFIRGDLKYFQVTNKDAVNYARIRVKATNLYCFDIKLDAGQSFIMGNAKESVTRTAATFATFDDVESISAQAYGGAVDMEYVVASI